MKTIFYKEDVYAAGLYQKMIEVSAFYYVRFIDVAVGSEINFENKTYIVNRIIFDLDNFEKSIFLTEQTNK